MAQSKTPQVDYDGLFKAFVFRRFRDFLSFAIPVLHDQVNWQHDPQFLEQELIDEVRSNHKRKSKRLHTDHLVKVQLYNGEARLVYVHIEFQHKPETDFGLRMFNYMMRIRMKHNTRQVTAVAVFSGAPPPASALMYQEEVMGTFTSYRFNSIIAAHQDEAALMASQNTFAILVLAAKYVYEVKKDEGRLFALKRKLMELSLKLNLDRGSTIEILIFVKDLMVLSEENEQLLEKEINHLMGTTKIRRPIPFTERTWRFLDNLYAELNGGKSPEELIAEAKKHAEEEAADRIAEERRRAEEAAADRIAEERRRAEETVRQLEGERRHAEEERRRLEEAVVRLYSQFAMPAEQVAVAMNLTPIAVEEILHRYGHK